MGWLILFGCVAATLLALWKLGKLDRGAMELSGAAMLLAVAGYALQGKPQQPGSPTDAAEDLTAEAPPEEFRRTFQSAMNSEGQWLQLADALMQSGRTRAAVSILNEGTKRAPKNADVWVGLGNALFVHGGGQMNPAAQYAFEQAAAIAPNHPGPPFFLGYGLAQSGKMDEAGEVWRALLERAPDDAPWKADLEARLASIGQAEKASAPAGK